MSPDVFSPDGPLSPLGEKQARLTAQHFIGAGITHVLSSPLVRALATASTIADAAGISRVEVWFDLREGHSGTHRCHGGDELSRLFPRAPLPHEIAADGWEHGGDTPASMSDRAVRVLDMLRLRFVSDHKVVVVGHGGFTNYLLHTILRIPSTAPQWFEMVNGAITTVRLVPERERSAWPLYPPVEAEVLAVNDISHLSGVSRFPRSSRE